MEKAKEESKVHKVHSLQKLPVYDSVNEMLTIESMFQIKDSESGQVMDLRELLDLNESDFANHEELKSAL